MVALGWPLGGIFTSYTLDRHKESGLFFFLKPVSLLLNTYWHNTGLGNVDYRLERGEEKKSCWQGYTVLATMFQKTAVLFKYFIQFFYIVL